MFFQGISINHIKRRKKKRTEIDLWAISATILDQATVNNIDFLIRFCKIVLHQFKSS